MGSPPKKDGKTNPGPDLGSRSWTDEKKIKVK
jgi:hypothetical protein